MATRKTATAAPRSARPVTVRRDGEIAIVTLNRPEKRNALGDDMVALLDRFFAQPPAGVRAAVITGAGTHFSAGLDLSTLRVRDVVEGMHHSRSWHIAFEKIQFGRIPVVAAMHGAVIGGGLELAAAAHVRVADETVFYALPEGQRGIFVGGGGSARLPRLIGVACMTDMMLTGRVYKAQEGAQRGFAQYLVPPGEALGKAVELARKMAGNAGMTNYAVMHALPRIADSTQEIGLFTESLIATIASSAPEARERVQAFLAGRAGKVKAD
ncbi:MAG: crotonase/enoyl-CoA hydratase family protein [Burkholderiales bacterium]|nr:crotonase/enoyl-CoA hydratase family protein [Burkholderiales bacterium]